MIITLANQKGGVGKTTLAFNLVFELKADCVIDLDPQQHLLKFNRYRDMVGLPLMPLVEKANKETLQQLLKTHQGEGDRWCVIDTAGVDADLGRYAAAMSDLVVIPTNDDMVELWSTKSFAETIKAMAQELGQPIAMLAVLNRIHPQAAAPAQALELLDRVGVTVANTLIRQRSPMAQSASLGKIAAEHKSAWASREEIAALANEIRQRVGNG